MQMERLDNVIKDGLAKRLSSAKIERTTSCPSEAKLNDYMHQLLSKGEQRLVAEHIKSCYWCIEQLDQIQRARSLPGENMPTESRLMQNLVNWIKKNRWLIAAIVTFILSFVFSRYFLQFLILTLLVGIKWVFTTGGTKTIIMIYDALRKKDRV